MTRIGKKSSQLRNNNSTETKIQMNQIQDQETEEIIKTNG